VRGAQSGHHRATRRPELVELTCALDGNSHLVGLDVFAAAARSQNGVFPAVCGHEVMAVSMSTPPGPLCRPCSSL
jgi:hypothetical protein